MPALPAKALLYVKLLILGAALNLCVPQRMNLLVRTSEEILVFWVSRQGARSSEGGGRLLTWLMQSSPILLAIHGGGIKVSRYGLVLLLPS